MSPSEPDPQQDPHEAEYLDEILHFAFDSQMPESPPQTTSPSPPETIAGYRIIGELGRGGMGTVYEAEQQSPRRRVALKIARTAVHPSARNRFEYECQILGRLRHESVAEIYQAGAHEVPGIGVWSFFAMELVEDALPITTYADRNDYDVRERVGLLAAALEGISHGHERGVVHRDLKPSNLLVDGEGSVKVIDFGLARVLASDDTLASMQTRSGELLGTPQYMSPEQWRNPTDADAAADVYSMGVILFELLAGSLPYDLAGKSMLEIGETVQREPPTSLRLPGSSVHGDLNVIAQKAMEKERDHRYPNARELLDDLRRFLANEPIAARPPTTLYQLRKFARRHRGLVIGTILVMLVTITGAVVSLIYAMQANERGELLDSKLYAARVSRAFLAYREGSYRQVQLLANSTDLASDAWEWRRLRHLTRDRSLHAFTAAGMNTRPMSKTVAPSPDGRNAVVGCKDGRLRIYSIDTGEVTRTIATGGAVVESVAWQGDQILSGDLNGIAHLHDALTGAKLGRFDVAPEVARTARRPRILDAVFGPDPGQLLVSSSPPGRRAHLFSIADGSLLYETRRARCLCGMIAVRPDAPGQYIVTDTLFHGGAKPEEGQRMLHGRGPRRVVVSPVGDRVVFANHDRHLHLWDLASGDMLWYRFAHDGDIFALAISPDGTQIASGGDDDTIKIWDADTGDLRQQLHGHRDRIATVHFLSQDELLSSSADGTVRSWQLAAADRDESIRLQARTHSDVVFLDDHNLLIGGVSGPSVFLDLETEQVRKASKLIWGRSIAVRPAANEYAIASSLQVTISRFGADAHASLTTRKPATAIAFDHAGSLLVCGDFTGHIQCWNADDHTLIWQRTIELGEVTDVEFRGDDGAVAIGSASGQLLLLARGDGRVLWQQTQTERIECLSFHPTANSLAIGLGDGTVQVLDAADGHATTELAGYSGAATALQYVDEGRRLFVGYSTGIVRLWTDFGSEVWSERCLNGPVHGIAISPNGSKLAVAGDDRALRILCTRPWRDGTHGK